LLQPFFGMMQIIWSFKATERTSSFFHHIVFSNALRFKKIFWITVPPFVVMHTETFFRN
jgi:hypothetical protein